MEEGDPKDAIEWRDLGLGILLAARGQLLAKSQLDDRLLAAASEEGWRTTQNKHQEVEYRPHEDRDVAGSSAHIRV
ncbi:MAG TPA: hypothetical protein EYQ60_20140 [Myxococcales bacterium]|nr:hypothetical protein [Myxococcales bacterium]